MNQQNSGETPSLEQWDKYLDGQDEKVGLNGGNNSVFKYINATEQEMRGMSADECGEAAAILAAFAFKIQKRRNSLSTRAYWCEQKLRKELAPQMNKITAYSYDERRGQSLINNNSLNEIDKQRVAADGAAQRLDYLPARLEFLAQTYLSLQNTKRKHREYN